MGCSVGWTARVSCSAVIRGSRVLKKAEIFVLENGLILFPIFCVNFFIRPETDYRTNYLLSSWIHCFIFRFIFFIEFRFSLYRKIRVGGGVESYFYLLPSSLTAPHILNRRCCPRPHTAEQSDHSDHMNSTEQLL